MLATSDEPPVGGPRPSHLFDGDVNRCRRLNIQLLLGRKQDNAQHQARLCCAERQADQCCSGHAGHQQLVRRAGCWISLLGSADGGRRCGRSPLVLNTQAYSRGPSGCDIAIGLFDCVAVGQVGYTDPARYAMADLLVDCKIKLHEPRVSLQFLARR
jgi:hypothetical protein